MLYLKQVRFLHSEYKKTHNPTLTRGAIFNLIKICFKPQHSTFPRVRANKTERL
jgi:hypothetical protein